MAKPSRFQVFIIISASGPEDIKKVKFGNRTYRPRKFGELKCTKADSLYFESVMSDPTSEELIIRLEDPSIEDFVQSVDKGRSWLSRYKEDPLYDGGGVTIVFAGHGRYSDGALVLKDGFITPESLYRDLNQDGVFYKVCIVLDSCFSSLFTLNFLDLIYSDENCNLYPLVIYASSMPDEESWEDGNLGHGIYTYSFSVREENLGDKHATAIQPDNTFGPSVSICAGALGCSLITYGLQNPVLFEGDTLMFEIASRRISIENGFNKQYVLKELKKHRDEFRGLIKKINTSISYK